ncbi:uncharacterized protein LOC124171685 [Ischnura elegans]|uniref:uncharacterized protein LOC124171685 n=1 Tax=Ischnura elegans TaxID=197161 RepID=UPI001ED8993F|nr:uncharacterized protein LOC124171685 [Ischnura elegans]XP_046406882.1 uncharacterized protein LOC124171685 [Ischnura elegans]
MEGQHHKEHDAGKGVNFRVSLEQRAIMLQFMEEHPAFGRNQLCGPQGAASSCLTPAPLLHMIRPPVPLPNQLIKALREGGKRKREKSDDNSTSLDERMVKAAEVRRSVMAQVVESFQAVANELMEYLRSH